MTNSRANIRYVRALYALGEEYGVSEQIYADMKYLRSLFTADAELRTLMSNPTIPKGLKHKALMFIFENKIESLSLRFLDLLVYKNREANIDMIAREYVHMYSRLNHISRVEIDSVVPVGEEIKQMIETKVKGWGASKIELKTKIKPELLGGFTLRVDGHYIDLSVRGRLRTIEKNLRRTVYQKK